MKAYRYDVYGNITEITGLETSGSWNTPTIDITNKYVFYGSSNSKGIRVYKYDIYDSGVLFTLLSGNLDTGSWNTPAIDAANKIVFYGSSNNGGMITYKYDVENNEIIPSKNNLETIKEWNTPAIDTNNQIVFYGCNSTMGGELGMRAYRYDISESGISFTRIFTTLESTGAWNTPCIDTTNQIVFYGSSNNSGIKIYKYAYDANNTPAADIITPLTGDLKSNSKWNTPVVDTVNQIVFYGGSGDVSGQNGMKAYKYDTNNLTVTPLTGDLQPTEAWNAPTIDTTNQLVFYGSKSQDFGSGIKIYKYDNNRNIKEVNGSTKSHGWYTPAIDTVNQIVCYGSSKSCGIRIYKYIISNSIELECTGISDITSFSSVGKILI